MESSNYENEKKTNKFSKLSVVFILIIIFISIIFAIIMNIPVDIEQIKDSVVMIKVYNKEDELISTGSGFCIFNSDCIVTNYHVVEGAYKIKIITDDNIERNVDIVDIVNKTYDMAILKGEFNLIPLEIGNTEKLKAGMEVTAIGSPEGEKNTVSTGIISNADSDYEIRITAPISPGSSGGVLLNKNNKVIGVTFATYDSAEAQNLNYAISIDYFEDMYNSIDNGENLLLVAEIDTDKNYRPMTMSSFYRWTNPNQIFYYDRLELFSEWQEIFDGLSKKEQNEIVDLYFLIEEYVPEKNIKDWESLDYVLNLTSLDKAEYLIIQKDLSNYKDTFDRINSYDLSVKDKAYLGLIIGGLRPNDYNNTDANAVIDAIDELDYSIEEKKMIAEYLGYTIKGDNVYW